MKNGIDPLNPKYAMEAHISNVKSRVNSKRIWQAIANGVLFTSEDPPPIEYTEALYFIQDVAKKIVIADAELSTTRSGSIARSAQLSGKNTKYESELVAAINLVDDFFPTNDEELQVGKKKDPNRNAKIVKAFRAIAQISGDEAFDLYLNGRTDGEISKDIQRIRKKI